MKLEGNIRKMYTELQDEVQYYLPIGNSKVYLNDLLNKTISIVFKGTINCIKCGRITKISFAQGFCYPCFISVPETEECVLRPELCRAHEGVARDMKFAEKNCLIDHFVYFALTPGLKVGVTRHTQVPTRWIDQGAGKAIKLAKTPNRYTAGLIEVALKNIYPDKTNWRKMLSEPGDILVDLIEEKGRAEENLPFDMRDYIVEDDEVTQITYPIVKYPVKIKSTNLDKTKEIKGKLSGIKGQYLIFEGGEVINIRKHAGYFLDISF